MASLVRVTLLPLALLAAWTVPLSLTAGERADRAKTVDADEAETVELFAAIEAGLLDVRFIPRDSTLARVQITNKTAKPLNVQLPEKFAAQPVLAQRGGGFGGGGRGGGGGFGGGGGQAMGGGMMGGGMMGGGMGMGMGGGMMNLTPEKLGEVKVRCVCLEHGKPEPKPRMKYEIKPLEAQTTRPEVHELIKLFAANGLDQRVVQAAIWHLENDMSWEELASKRIERANGFSYPYFAVAELQQALQLANIAVQTAEKNESSPGESDLLKSPSPGELSALGEQEN